MEIATQERIARCNSLDETHILSLPPCCPMSGNPQAGSRVRIKYTAGSRVLEVQSLRAYVDSYKGGKGDVRSMEAMIEQITQDCANAVRGVVYVTAELLIEPGQEMILECIAYNKTAHPRESENNQL